MKKEIKIKKGIALWKEAKKIIPGGNQLLSKRSEMFLPDQWPSYFKKAKGIEVWDLDGNKFIDMSHMGVGTCALGYADSDVNWAVKKAIDEGSMCTLNSPEEVELANLLLKLHPWAEMVRYARTGGEALAVAVRIARAYTGKDTIAFCGYHGWHDWYLSANLANGKNLDGQLLPGLLPLGVPRALKGTMLPFNYNKIEELKKVVQENDIGVIVMEPQREHEPQVGFLEEIRRIAMQKGIVLIFDEITSGFRMNVGGIHMLTKIYPDIAVLGKAMGNGYPMAAIIGTKKVMDAAQNTFISSTYWTERIGPVAALATIRKMQKYKIPKHLCAIGKRISAGWQKSAKKHGLNIKTFNIPSLATFSFDYGESSQAMHTLFTQEMLKRGYLASKSVYATYSHKLKDVDAYLANIDEVFALIKKAVGQNKVNESLKGPIAHQSFKRLT
ncbi:MAG: aminotransferase class III-fold pyridoxal phosphate-dependent enzyme [Minisyncoccales bacterium]